MPELRYSRLRGEWVAYATERNDRTFLPAGPPGSCPLCPSGPGGSSEIPLDDFEVAVFENRFPALGPDRGPDGRPPRPPSTGCEVVVYTPDHDATLAGLDERRVRLLVDVWADRYLRLGSRDEVAYVFEFENKGEAMGVTLHHPHGQIYAMPFVPPVAAAELAVAARHRHATGRCVHCDLVAAERDGERLVFAHRGVVAFVPEAARWPYELHLYPERHAGSLADLGSADRDAVADALLEAVRTYDRHFGFSTPYVMAIHQAPTGASWAGGGDAHVHVELYPPNRRPDRLKYIAGVELGAGTFVNDTLPERTAAQLRRASRLA
jgi:UDPglucose--hexose-1-phosphate uridylyltransferase